MNFNLILNMSDFNKPVQIEEPKDAESVIKLLKEYYENEYGNYSYNLDKDKDGLSNYDEEYYGSDENNPDTDGDGYKDGDEVRKSFDPTMPGVIKIMKKPSSTYVSIYSIKSWASSLKLDTVKFNECLDKNKYEQKIINQSKEAQSMGVVGVPVTFINGYPVSGAQNISLYKEIIDAILANKKVEAIDSYKKQFKDGKVSKPVKINISKDYSKGTKNAKITIVEYSDFDCPFCKTNADTLEQLFKDKKYEGKINFVYKNFPMSYHKDAKAASMAVECAGEQGKFWEMHDKMFGIISTLPTIIYPDKIDEKKEIQSSISSSNVNDLDSKRNLYVLSIGLENYYKENKSYPVANSPINIDDEKSPLIKLAPKYFSEIFLNAPKDGHFTYKSDGENYELSAIMENKDDKWCVMEGSNCVYKIKNGVVESSK